MPSIASVLTSAPVAPTASATQSDVESEVSALFQAVHSVEDQAASSGPLARELLAKKLGVSANKSGRPTADAFLAFVLATRSCSMQEMVRLGAIANRSMIAALDGRKDVVTVTTKTDAFGNLTSKVTVKRPVDLDGTF